MNKQNSAKWIIGGILLTAIGFVVIPPLLNHISTKLYKSSLKKDEINIDSLEPEIVKKTEKENA